MLRSPVQISVAQTLGRSQAECDGELLRAIGGSVERALDSRMAANPAQRVATGLHPGICPSPRRYRFKQESVVLRGDDGLVVPEKNEAALRHTELGHDTSP